VDVCYAGDDTYVGTSTTMEVKPEELPSAPPAFKVPVSYLLLAIGVALIAVGVLAAAKAAKHTVVDLAERRRRFVRRKRTP